LLGFTFFLTVLGIWMTLQRDIGLILVGNSFITVCSHAILFLSIVSAIFWVGKVIDSSFKELVLFGGVISFLAWQIILLTEWLKTGLPVIYSPMYQGGLSLLLLSFFSFGAILSLIAQIFINPSEAVPDKSVERKLMYGLYVCLNISLMLSLLLHMSLEWFLAINWGFLGASLLYIAHASRPPIFLGHEIFMKQNFKRNILLGPLPMIVLATFLTVQSMQSIPRFSFFSDESVYIYASYAMSRGATPYIDVAMVHPPIMYAIYAGLIRLLGNELYFLRFFNVILFFTNVYISYLVAKTILGGRINGKIFGIISMLLYGLYDFNFMPIATAENILTLFTVACVFFLAKFLMEKSLFWLFISGLFGGCALMTKYISIIFLVSLSLFYLIVRITGRHKVSHILKGSSLFLVGVSTVPAIVIACLAKSGALENFYTQTYYWQMIRFVSRDLTFGALQAYYSNFLPLLIFAAIGTLFLLENVIATRRLLLLLPICLFEICALLTFGLRQILYHYWLYLSPYLSMLSASSLYFPVETIVTHVRDPALRRKFTGIAIVVIVVVGSTICFIPLNQQRILEERSVESPYTQVQFDVGNCVSSLTSPNEKIWTSEGAIAFFAHRLIVPPNSKQWPASAFYDDFFSFSHGEDTSEYMKDCKYGVITIEEFISAWDMEKTGVIIIIRGEGPIPYPDELMWNGFRGQKGIAEYVQGHYNLYAIYGSPNIPYRYEIWVRA